MGLGWENKGYWHIKGKECMIWVATRPHYCDRGNYLAHLEARGNFARDVDEADGWPRYYFNFDIMKQEVESWLKTRKQYVDSNWINDDGHNQVVVSKVAEDIKEILSAENKGELIAICFVHENDKILEFVFGDFYNPLTIKVPFSFFEKSGNGVEPDFTDISIIDHGHTVKLGKYEASNHVILEARGKYE